MLRTTLAALAAALTLSAAIAPAAPAASVPGGSVTAEPTAGGTVGSTHGTTARTRGGGDAKAKRQLCSDLKLIRDVNRQEAVAAASGSGTAGPFLNTAARATADARKAGCGWAR